MDAATRRGLTPRIAQIRRYFERIRVISRGDVCGVVADAAGSASSIGWSCCEVRSPAGMGEGEEMAARCEGFRVGNWLINSKSCAMCRSVRLVVYERQDAQDQSRMRIHRSRRTYASLVHWDRRQGEPSRQRRSLRKSPPPPRSHSPSPFRALVLRLIHGSFHEYDHLRNPYRRICVGFIIGEGGYRT